MMIGSSGTRIHSTQAPSANAPKMARAITPNPKLPVAVADGTLRNQPREVTWLRTESRMACVGAEQAALRGQIPGGAGRLAAEQVGQQHHLVRRGGDIRVDQRDAEVVLAGL